MQSRYVRPPGGDSCLRESFFPLNQHPKSILMKLHLPAGLRSALMACFAAVSGMVATAFSTSSAQAEAVTWDANWGVSGAPTEIAAANVISNVPSGFTFLSSTAQAYMAGGNTVVGLAGTADGASDVRVIGGAGTTSTALNTSEGPLSVNTWLSVTGGDYTVIAGGSYAQNYQGGPLSSFTGDSHIQLSESAAGTQPATSPVVGYIIGGNYNDAQSAPFTGNSYISVQGGEVTGSIVGGGTSGHSQTAVFNGNSNVWVYTPLSGTAESLNELQGNLIVGGNSALANAQPKLQQTGDSSVHIDLSAHRPASGDPGMEKIIIGDAWVINSGRSTHTGNSSVSINGKAADGTHVLFSQPVVAGAYFGGAGTASLSGSSALTVEGGEYSNALVGGSYLAASTANVSSTTTGGSSVTLGGDLLLRGENACVVGGSYVDAQSGTLESGPLAVTLNGGRYEGNVIGGSYIAAGSGTVTQTTGDVTVTVNGGTVDATIYGGSYTERDDAASTNAHGAITVSLAGGTVNGNVYAGGGVGELVVAPDASAYADAVTPVQGGIQAASTQVEVSDAVVLGSQQSPVTISGGVQNANDATSITGNRTLLLSAASYNNLANAIFADFNVVDVAGNATIRLEDVEAGFTKLGAGTLSFSNALDTESLTVQAGTVAFDTTGATLGALALEGGNALVNSGTTTVETLTDTEAGGTLSIAPAATLATTGTSTLENAQISATAAGAGTLAVQGNLTLADAARLNGVVLNVDGGTLTLDATAGHSVAALNGNGTVQGTGTVDTVGLSVSGTGGNFEGALSGNGTLTVGKGATQTFASGFTGNAGWNLVNNGAATLNFVKSDGTNAAFTMGTLSMGQGSVTTLMVNPNAAMGNLLTLGTLTAGQGAAVTLATDGTGDLVKADTSYVIGTVSDGQAAGEIAGITPYAPGSVFMLVDGSQSNLSVDDAGNIVLNLVTSRRNQLAALATNSNSATGASLLWKAAFSGNTTSGTDIRNILNSLNSGISRGRANAIMAAVSGAGISVLSSAMADDVERQLRAIRNRTTLLTSLPCRDGKGRLTATEPRFSVWVNGEGDHHKLEADGYMPGYTLTTWGGTLGMDVACRSGMTAGLALTALSGDLKAHSADNAEGDFNRYYLSAFARKDYKRWQSTLLGTVGRLDADLDRHVYYGGGSYRTHGSTDGWGYGLMYELGYNYPVAEDATFTLQPVVNVSWKHVDVDGYTENGSDAGLRVGDLKYDVFTFGAGFRTKAEIGESFFNRRGIFEARALVKVDAGDHRGEANVSMLGGGGAWGHVRSEKLSKTGVELGAGISVPLGDDAGFFFIDGTAELRNSYTNLNGTVGYRFEF